MTSEVGLNGFGDEVEGAAFLLAAGFDDGEHRFDEAAAVGALRAERELSPDHGVTQGPLAGVVGRLDPLDANERPQPIAVIVSSRHIPAIERLPLPAPRSSKRSTSRRTGAMRRTKAAREIVPAR